MITTGTMRTAPTPEKAAGARSLSERDPRTRDELREAAGEGYDLIPVKGAVAARLAGVAEGTWHKQRAGQRASKLSRACEAVYEAALEAQSFEEAGYSAAYADATLKSVAMRPVLEKLTTPELDALLSDTYRRETEIQGQLDVLQMRRAQGLPVGVETERRLWAEQAALSERAMCILDLLEDRPGYV